VAGWLAAAILSWNTTENHRPDNGPYGRCVEADGLLSEWFVRQGCTISELFLKDASHSIIHFIKKTGLITSAYDVFQADKSVPN